MTDLALAVVETAVRTAAVARLLPFTTDPRIRADVERIAHSGALWAARAREWLELAEVAA